MPVGLHILFVCTSTGRSSWGSDTGVWLEEIACPYYLFREAGYRVDIASVKGSPVPVDPASYKPEFMHAMTRRYIDDAEAQAAFKSVPSLSAVVSSGLINDYCCIYLVGGHGCIDDFPNNEDIKRAVEIIYTETKGCVAAICHGPLGLAHCTFNGQLMLKGKFTAAFSNEEENELGLRDKVPVLTESVVDEAGAICVPGPPWKPNAVVDGRVVTGQNPQSSVEIAHRVLDVLRTMGDGFNAPENVNKPWGQ